MFSTILLHYYYYYFIYIYIYYYTIQKKIVEILLKNLFENDFFQEQCNYIH